MSVSRPHPLRGRILLALFLSIASFALLSRAAAFPDWTDCPAMCRCKWTSGKKSALCPDAGLTSLPASLDPDMQVLDLSGNKIPTLQSEIFKRAGLVNLQRVFMRNAGVEEIHADAFREMRILVEVDLSDNRVSSLDPNTFLGNERLRVLILSGNPLGTLTNHQFPKLEHLRTLELQRCTLGEIRGQAFSGLGGLESLRLDANQLEYLDSTVVSHLSHLKTLSLDGNRWQCDCRLRDFRNWLIPSTSGRSQLYSVSQTCQGPERLRDRRWEDVKSVEFGCKPAVTILRANNVQELEGNGNLTLACLATGDPEPEIWWLLNGGPMNVSRRSAAGGAEDDEPSDGNATLDGANRATERWSNFTVYNASDGDAGEYTCFARNVAGLAQDSVTVAIQRVLTAPTLSQTDDWLLWVSLAGGGAAALCASVSAVLLAVCLCSSGSRRKSKREKVKLQGSASFGDQEKKLLDLSVTTTTGTGGNDRGSCRSSIPEATNCCGSPRGIEGELELTERGCNSACDAAITPASVTVERYHRHPQQQQQQDGRRPAETSPGALLRSTLPCSLFPPPPPEFTTGVLPAGVFGNIFISVSLPQDPLQVCTERRYPDLLDIPVHAAEKSSGAPPPAAAATTTASIISGFATLPRRPLRVSDLGSPYDNMGPRVTATGSSTFSLTDVDLRLSPPPPPPPPPPLPLIQPPLEFVSL